MIQSIALFFIAFLVGADELLLGSILEPIGGDLGVPPSQVTLFITAYSLAALFRALVGSSRASSPYAACLFRFWHLLDSDWLG